MNRRHAPSVERLLATTPTETLEAMMAEVCAHADELFEGSKARFTLIVWPEGFEAEEGSLAIAAQPEAKSAAATALLTAHRALVKQAEAAR